MLQNPKVTMKKLTAIVPELQSIGEHILQRAEVEGRRDRLSVLNTTVYYLPARYAPYLIRQEADLKVFLEDENMSLPSHVDYRQIEGLSSEVRERLSLVRPTNVVCFQLSLKSHCRLKKFQKGAAKRMEGMTPTSLIALIAYSRRLPRAEA